MNLNNTIKNIFLTTITLFLFTACGGGGSQTGSHSLANNMYNTSDGEVIILGSNTPICQTGDAKQFGQIRDFKTGKTLNDVLVTVGGCSTRTDKNGYYKFENIPSSSRASIALDKDGYYKNSKIISINNNTSNYIELFLEETKHEWTYKSDEGAYGKVAIAPDNIYKNTNDSNYTGNITASYTFKGINSKWERDMFPGSYKGLDSNNIVVPFISYGFMVLELKDKDKNNLNISGHIIVKVDNIHTNNEEVIPLWFYNYNRGIWVEDGTAQRDENGDYICEISHPGTWSLSKPVETETGMYKGRIIDENENPISNVRVKAMGKDWVSQDLTTDENGEFALQVVPDQTFKITAYDYKEKYGAAYPNTIPAISAGDVIEE